MAAAVQYQPAVIKDIFLHLITLKVKSSLAVGFLTNFKRHKTEKLGGPERARVAVAK